MNNNSHILISKTSFINGSLLFGTQHIIWKDSNSNEIENFTQLTKFRCGIMNIWDHSVFSLKQKLRSQVSEMYPYFFLITDQAHRPHLLRGHPLSLNNLSWRRNWTLNGSPLSHLQANNSSLTVRNNLNIYASKSVFWEGNETVLYKINFLNWRSA
jgi:vacuolar-type H+-ATPase subunit F/Vma7